MISPTTISDSAQRWVTRLQHRHAVAWMLVPGSIWFIAGLYLDGWAHNHGKVDNTFFTPWHAVFYSGYLLLAGTLGVIVLLTQLRGLTWQTHLAPPLRSAIIAAPLFALAGVGDLWWHTTFGFETGIEPLLSPPHLVLASSMFFMVGAAARLDDGTHRGWHQLPSIISIAAAWGVVTFMWQFNHPYGIVWPETLRGGGPGIMTGIAGLVANSALTAAVAIILATRQMPYGTLTAVLVVNALGIALMGDEYRFGWSALCTGILSEGLWWWWRYIPPPARIRRHAFVVASMTSASYMAVIYATTAILWPIHIWLGAIVLAGVAGWALTIIMPITAQATEH